MANKYALLINGKPFSVEAEPDTPLLHILREQLDLTGTKYGCGEGQCGACTVLVDGRARQSCMTPISIVSGNAITTVEGLAKKLDEALKRLALLDPRQSRVVELRFLGGLTVDEISNLLGKTNSDRL
jgi:aerobic-type carbon monoxide dehydrogenase small subunit (CoxS/CutS family)